MSNTRKARSSKIAVQSIPQEPCLRARLFHVYDPVLPVSFWSKYSGGLGAGPQVEMSLGAGPQFAMRLGAGPQVAHRACRGPRKRAGRVDRPFPFREWRVRYSCCPMNISRNWNMFRKLM